MKPVIGLLALLGTVAAIVAARVQPEKGPGAPSVFVVRRGTLPVRLIETGTLKTKNASSIRSSVEGQAKIAWLIEEGAAVKSNDTVCQLDPLEVKEKLEELERQRIQGESELGSAKSELLVQEMQSKTEVEKAELRVDVARVSLKKLKEGDIPKELKTRELRIDKDKADLQRAEERYKPMPDLAKQGFVSKTQVEEERLKVEAAKVELETANQDMELYVKYQKPLDEKTKEAEVGESERELVRVKSRCDSQVDQKKAVVLQRELTLKSTTDRIARDNKRLGEMTLRAPTEGVVVYGDPDNWRGEEVKVGAQVYQNQVICTIPDTTEMAVALQVHEADINQLRIGAPATVTLDTYKGRVFEGEVSRIAAVAVSGGWRDDVKKFAVDVALVGSSLHLRTGITAKVEIKVGELQDVIHVPLQAIIVKDGKHRAFVRRTGRAPEVRDVEVGRANDDFVEVKTGLEPGEEVYLYDPSAEGASK